MMRLSKTPFNNDKNKNSQVLPEQGWEMLIRPYVRPSTNSVIFAFKKMLFGLLLTFIDLFRGFLASVWASFLFSGPGFGSFWGLLAWIWVILSQFRGSEPWSGPIFWVLGLDFDLFLGFGPGFGSFWANFGGYGPGFGLDLGLFWVLGLDLVHFGPISGVMGLDLGLFLGSGSRFGSF